MLLLRRPQCCVCSLRAVSKFSCWFHGTLSLRSGRPLWIIESCSDFMGFAEFELSRAAQAATRAISVFGAESAGALRPAARAPLPLNLAVVCYFVVLPVAPYRSFIFAAQ